MQSIDKLLPQLPVVLYKAIIDEGNLLFDYVGASLTMIADYAPAQLLDESNFWRQRIHPADWPSIEASLRHVQDRGRAAATKPVTYRHEYRWLFADGEYRWLLDSGRWVRDEAGGEGYIVGSWMDIDRDKTLEYQLRENEARFKLTLQGSATTVFIQDVDLRYTWIYNGLFEDTLGKDDYDLFPRDTAERLTRIKREVLETAKRKETEVVAMLPDGTRRMYDLRMEPLHDADGELVGVSSISVDITDLKMTQQALHQRSHELEQSNRDLEQFAYVASHDLQEPLRAISGYLNLLDTLYGKQLDEEARDFVYEAVSGAERMRKIIQGLLDYSRVNRNYKPFAQIAMTEVVQDAISNLQVLITENKAKITCDALPVIKADPVQMTQMFQNLIGNAIKFRHVERIPQIHIAVCEDAEANTYCFSVQDNGIGLEMRFAERIFTIFQRLHTRDVYEGTGIGLALCRRIVERHQGRIWVEAKPDEGSTFFFTVSHQL